MRLIGLLIRVFGFNSQKHDQVTSANGVVGIDREMNRKPFSWSYRLKTRELRFQHLHGWFNVPLTVHLTQGYFPSWWLWWGRETSIHTCLSVSLPLDLHFSNLNFLLPADSWFLTICWFCLLPSLCVSFEFSWSYYLCVFLCVHDCWMGLFVLISCQAWIPNTEAPEKKNLFPAPCAGGACGCVKQSEFYTLLPRQCVVLFWSDKYKNEISEKLHDYFISTQLLEAGSESEHSFPEYYIQWSDNYLTEKAFSMQI